MAALNPRSTLLYVWIINEGTKRRNQTLTSSVVGTRIFDRQWAVERGKRELWGLFTLTLNPLSHTLISLITFKYSVTTLKLGLPLSGHSSLVKIFTCMAVAWISGLWWRGEGCIWSVWARRWCSWPGTTASPGSQRAGASSWKGLHVTNGATVNTSIVDPDLVDP